MVVISVEIIPETQPEEITQKWDGLLITSNDFNLGEKVIIKTEKGIDLGKIIKIEVRPNGSEKGGKNKKIILRKATSEDLKKYEKKNSKKEKEESVEEVKKIIKKYKLPIKITDVIFSFDSSRVVIVFTAPARVDFRELVKELSHKFHRSIRMYQVGVRDEAERLGDIGPCGQTLCCKSFLKKINSISTSLLSSQQLFSRGSERMTGVCGRLKCCLAFEEKVYKELSKNFPAIGKEVKTKKGEGKVLIWKILKQSLIIETKDGARIEVRIDEIIE